MAEPMSLRIGICKCTSLYHGQLEGRKLCVNDRTFILHEVPIPENHQAKTLKENDCRVFLDIHRHKGKLMARIVCIDPILWGYPSVWIYIGTNRTIKFHLRRIKSIEGLKPPTLGRIIKILTRLIGSLAECELKQWLYYFHTPSP